MGDKFWWWIKRIRFLAACAVGGLAGFYVIYKSGVQSDYANEFLGGGIAIVVAALLYYLPEWIIRLITNTRGEDELDGWMEEFLNEFRKPGKDDDRDY